jgi:hypothetical protein
MWLCLARHTFAITFYTIQFFLGGYMATLLKQTVYDVIREHCLCEIEAVLAAEKVANLVEEKFTSANRPSTPCAHKSVSTGVTTVCLYCGSIVLN